MILLIIFINIINLLVPSYHCTVLSKREQPTALAVLIGCRVIRRFTCDICKCNIILPPLLAYAICNCRIAEMLTIIR